MAALSAIRPLRERVPGLYDFDRTKRIAEYLEICNANGLMVPTGMDGEPNEDRAG